MKKHQGFTLIELMLVIVIMGYLVTLVRLPSLAPDPFDLVEKHAKTISTQINLASEFAVLNNVQLGLAVTESRYSFLMFDGEKWQPLAEPPFVAAELEPELHLELVLDGLAWHQENLLSAVEFIDEESLEELAELSEEEKQLAFPQIFLLSSGELSPFDLRITYDNGFDDTVEFLVRGLFTSPVNLYDPLQQLELD